MREDRYYWLSSWLAYCDKCATSFIPRIGTIKNGLTDGFAYKGNEIYKKPEFVAEHEGRSAYLYQLLRIWSAYDELPDAIEGVHTIKRLGDNWLEDQISPIACLFLQIHDICERELGDTLEDGSNNHQEAKELEPVIMEEHFSHYPSPVADKLQAFYPLFESYGKEGDADKFGELLAREACFAKAVDKADAIGYQLFLATKGRFGDILLKQPPSGRDLRFAKILNTQRAVDIYTLALRVASKHFDHKLLHPITSFLKTGFKDALQEVPLCMTIDVTNIELNLPEDNLPTDYEMESLPILPR